MSDFISRLAARAVGQSTVAQPRPDLLFADMEPVPAEIGPAVEPVERTHVIVDPAAVGETLTRVEAASVLRHTEHVHSSSERTSVEREPVDATRVVGEQAATGERLRERQAEPAPAKPATPVTAQIDAVAAVPQALEAIPLLPVAREEPLPEQPVRVHIGRLE